MQLTKFSDYALRTMIFTASATDRLVTIDEVSEVFDISRAHIKKVVTHLSRAGYLEAVRGRKGGVRLARPPQMINLGEVLRFTETGFDSFSCSTCRITEVCRLSGIGRDAMEAYLAVFDGKTLADIVVPAKTFDI